MIDLANILSHQYEHLPNGFALTIPESLPYFNGHFPENPILPAVAIVDISLYFLNEFLNNEAALTKNLSLRMKKLSSLKVKSPMRPNEKYFIEFEVAIKNWDITWKKATDELVAAEIRLELAEQPQ